MYDKLVATIYNIDTGGFVLKTKYDRDKSDLEKKFLLVVVIIFIFGNLKDCLIKILQLLLQLIIASIHN